ncbi:hypothetical protein RFI_25920, partial [Reticulomyxa filosa]
MKLCREFVPPFFIFFPPNFNLIKIKLLHSQEKEPWVQQYLTKSIIFFLVVVEKFSSLSLQYLIKQHRKHNAFQLHVFKVAKNIFERKTSLKRQQLLFFLIKDKKKFLFTNFTDRPPGITSNISTCESAEAVSEVANKKHCNYVSEV